MEIPPPPVETNDGGQPPEPRGRRTLVVAIAIVVVLAIAGVAVAVSQMGIDEPSTSATASGSPSPSDSPPAAPGNVEAAPAPFKVVVTWARAGGDVAGYRVYRDGDVLDEVAADARRFTDDTVAPSSRYRYEVASFSEAGDTSDRTDVSVKTPPASLALARLQGTFNAKLHLTWSFGLTISGGGPHTLGLRFSPVCDEGACNVTLGVIGAKIEHFTLKQAAATYSGAGTNRASFTCGGTPTSSSFTVKLTIVAAKSLKDEWRATKLDGTIEQRSSAQLGCVSSGTDESFTATLYPA
jgi:hypothetical protein